MNPLLQGLALQILHDNEGPAVVLADIVNRADLRMIERRSRPRFNAEPLERLRILRPFFRQELDRNGPAKPNIFGLVHYSHPAGSQLLNNSIVGNRLSDHNSEPQY